MQTHSMMIYLCTLFSLFSCAGSKNTNLVLQESTPFTITGAYYQDWIAGVKGGGSGTHLYFSIENMNSDIEIVDVYFRKQQQKATNTKENQYQVPFSNDLNRGDTILDSNPIKEAQNEVPKAIPFSLENNEAVLSYLQNGEKKYVKIPDLQEKPVLAYPSANPNLKEF